MRGEKLFLVLVISLFFVSLVSAEIGLGVSPSKFREHVVQGESEFLNVTVFNVGDEVVDVKLVAKGEISEFVKISSPVKTISPEPKPHEFPVKNGQSFYVVIKVPENFEPGQYYGSFSAIASGKNVSQFGANLAVVSEVEVNVLKQKGFFSRLNVVYYIVFGLVVVGLILFFYFNSSKNVKKKSKK